MALVKVPEKREAEMLLEFCNNSMFTFEGIDIESKEGKSSLKELEAILRATGYKEKDFLMYWFKGSVMNKHYGLTESNAYPDDVTFLVIPNYYNPIVKIQIGARWFDDIVYNNAIRQNAIDRRTIPDFDVDAEDLKLFEKFKENGNA